MNAYSNYKDSGVSGIEQIPKHWILEKIKFVATCNDEVLSDSTADDEIINYVEIGDVDYVNGITNTTEYEFKEAPSRARRITRPNDIIISTVRTYLKAIAKIAEQDLIVSTGFAVIRPRKIDEIFMSYALLAPTFIEEVMSRSFGVSYPAIKASSLMNIKICIPPLSEQKAIASFLNAKTKPIDEIIAKRERQIELLEEMKSAIISRAVTKGLNPNAKMKDSGIEWIGEVPEHWKVAKTLFLLSMPITDGPHETPKLYDCGIPFISAEAISGGEIDFSKMRGYISEEYYKECCKKYIPQIDDIYMIKSGATTGRIAKVKTSELFTIWSPLAVFRVNKHMVTSDYLYYVLKSDYYQRQVELGWNYGTQQNIGMRTLEKLLVAFPEVEEQRKISSYLDQETIKFGSRIAKRRKQIELLQEYKQALITAAVIGKIDVRDYIS